MKHVQYFIYENFFPIENLVTKEPFILLTEMAEVGDYLDALGDDESFIDLLDENDQQGVPMSPCS